MNKAILIGILAVIASVSVANAGNEEESCATQSAKPSMMIYTSPTLIASPSAVQSPTQVITLPSAVTIPMEVTRHEESHVTKVTAELTPTPIETTPEYPEVPFTGRGGDK